MSGLLLWYPTPIYILTNITKLTEKNPKTGLFWSILCFVLSYGYKFKSNNDSRIKTLFWASFSYLLINYIPEKVGISRIFVISWVFLGLCK